MNNKENLIRELIDVLDMSEMASKTIENVINQFDLKDSKYSQINQADLNEFYEMIIPIYSKYFTENDIIKMLEFHKSDVGVKMKKVTPDLVQEARTVTKEWIDKTLQNK